MVFEKIPNFKQLAVELNKKANIHEEVNRRI